MKNKLFWVGASAYFIGDIVTTYVGLKIGAIEMNPFIKTFPFIFLAKAGALLLMFVVLKYLDYLSLRNSSKLLIDTSDTMKRFIALLLVSLGVGVGIINNSLVIMGEVL